MKKQKLERGEYGYLKQKKQKALSGTILMVLIGIVIFVVGLLLNKMEATNIFTVIAVCMVMPAAKYFVSYVVLFPYKPITVETKERLDSYAKVRGRSQSRKTMIEAIRNDLETRFAGIPVEKMHFAVAYSGACNQEVEDWVQEVQTAFPEAVIEMVDPLSLSVSCHIGPGALAVTLTAPVVLPADKN